MVDQDELWFAFQVADFSINIASFETDAQDLLQDMQEEALALLGDLVAAAATSDPTVGPSSEQPKRGLTRARVEELLDLYMATRDSARAAAVERTPASHAADDAAHEAMVRALFALGT